MSFFFFPKAIYKQSTNESCARKLGFAHKLLCRPIARGSFAESVGQSSEYKFWMSRRPLEVGDKIDMTIDNEREAAYFGSESSWRREFIGSIHIYCVSSSVKAPDM